MHKAIPVYVIPLLIIIGSILVGLLVDRLIMNRLAGKNRQGRHPALKIVSVSLRGIFIFMIGLAGIYIALNFLPMQPALRIKFGKILTAVMIFIVTVLLTRIAVGFIETHGRRRKMPSLTLFTNLTRIIIFTIGFLVILQSLGISITPVLTALGVGGLAVALALQNTLSNLFAGLYIIGTHLVTPGDYIKLSTGEEGYIKDVNWRNTIIVTMKNNENIIPNSVLSNSILTNYNRPEKEMTIIVPLSVGYESNLSQVENVAIQVAKDILSEVSGGVAEYTPVIRFTQLGESSINFNVILKVREFNDQYLIKHEFIKRIHTRFRQENIVIPFPARTVYLKSR